MFYIYYRISYDTNLSLIANNNKDILCYVYYFEECNIILKLAIRLLDNEIFRIIPEVIIRKVQKTERQIEKETLLLLVAKDKIEGQDAKALR